MIYTAEGDDVSLRRKAGFFLRLNRSTLGQISRDLLKVEFSQLELNAMPLTRNRVKRRVRPYATVCALRSVPGSLGPTP